jgi:hypothetical protein
VTPTARAVQQKVMAKFGGSRLVGHARYSWGSECERFGEVSGPLGTASLFEVSGPLDGTFPLESDEGVLATRRGFPGGAEWQEGPRRNFWKSFRPEVRAAPGLTDVGACSYPHRSRYALNDSANACP